MSSVFYMYVWFCGWLIAGVLGMCFHIPCMDEVYVVDMRTISFDVPPQEVRDLHKNNCRVK